MAPRTLSASAPTTAAARRLAMLQRTLAVAGPATSRASSTRSVPSTPPPTPATPGTPPPFQDILFESRGPTRIYTLNRPKALNAFSTEMFHALSEKADVWREDDSVDLVIGLGEGRAFASGGDIKSVVAALRDGNSKGVLSTFAASYCLNWKMGHMGKPYVAFIDGIVMGGGAGVSLPADIRIATARTIYAMPEQRLGFSPDFGGSYFMCQLDGAIGTWLAVTGQDVFGRAVYELGIASHYVAEEAVPELVSRLAALTRPTNEEISALVATYHVPAGEGVSSKANPGGQTPIRGAIRAFLDTTFSLPSLAAIYRRLNEAENDTSLDPEVREWAGEQRRIMATRTPTGMAVALTNYKLAGAAKRYATTLDQDILLGTGFGGEHRATDDLLNGGIHVLFDKKKTVPPFSPSIDELDDPSLTPESVRANFLTRGAKTLADAPRLNLVPPPKDNQGPDALYGHFRAYGIPSERTVRSTAESAGGRITEDELVRRVLDASGEMVRREEFGQVVRDIARRHLTRDGDGYVASGH